MGNFIIFIAIIAVVIICFVTVSVREQTRRLAAVQKYKNTNPQLRDAIINKIIRVGMSEEQVIDAWGTPMRRTFSKLQTKDKTILYFPYSRRVYLDNGNVTGWHTPTNTRSRSR
jgi:hypothetical protein